MKYVGVALLMYTGVLALLILWKQGVPGFNMSLYIMEGGFHLNLYTVLSPTMRRIVLENMFPVL
ncbi:hypothetical protein [Hungatella hathewayi]|uniref:hypothetical protein n=1 Tax=Hungatella hathewayi TaxID=154046 RepID=UPI0032E43091